MDITADEVIFDSVFQAEEFLNVTFENKVIELTLLDRFEQRTETFVVDRLVIDNILFDPAVIVIFSKDNKKYEVSKDEFFENVKLLN